MEYCINSLPTSVLIIFINSLDQDQEWQNVGPDSKMFDTLMLFSKEFFKEFDYAKASTIDKKVSKFTQ